MVFESVVSNLLNTYLNEFIDDLSANQLKIGAFSGNVELNNLAIKGNAFTSLNLPFRVVTGHIGKLTAVVPWVSLYTSPVVFNIQEVFILCVPNVDAKYDEDLEKEQTEADKKKQLQLVEEAMKSAYLKDRGIESQASYDFVTKLVAQIIKNLEIRIENIHICYEDKFTNPKRPFSIELSLEELKFVTIDEANQTNAQSYKENYFEKDVNLQSFSFYWNCSKDLELISELSEDDLQAKFFERITSHIYEPVINSVNGRGKFKRIVPDDPVKKQGDSFLLDFELEKFPVKLTQTQYKLMLEWSHFVDRTRKMWRNRKWRPTGNVKENPRSWWHYAINANLERFRKACKARTKEFQVERVKDIVDYYRAYYIYLTEPESMTDEMDEIKARIEEKLSFDELYCLREAVYDNMKKNREDVSLTNETNGSWGNWLTSWYFQSPETEKDIDGIVSSEPGQEAEMENISFNFHVPELTLELVTDFENHAQQSLARILMEDFLLFYKKDRDEEKESEAQITLASLVVEDLLVPLSSNHRYLMSSKICDLKSRPRAKSSPRKCDFLSSSCPSSPREYKLPTLSSCVSLPSKLQSANIYHLIPYSTQRRSKIHSHSSLSRRVAGCFHDEDHSLPGTPPPSPSNESASHNVPPIIITPDLGNSEDQTLVKISIIFVDENSPLFETKYNRNHRLTTVRFNSLETTINPETWAKFLNFFDHQPEKRSKYEDLSYLNSLSEAKREEQSSLNVSLSKPPSQINIDSKVDLTVRRLSIILNKPEDKPLAKANILGFSCLYSKSNNDISMEGKLKKLSITDLTMYNKIYKERFVTAGDEALHFHYFRYGHEDENLRREYDMKLELKMTSVQYVHTHRFYSEIMEFHKQFTALQARIKALSSPESLLQRASRIKLQIKAAAPVIVIPVHYLCEKVLVADFGQLNATNKFLFAGSPGTIGSVCKRSGLSQSDLIAASVRATYGVVTRVSSQSLVSRYVRLLEPKPCLLDLINVQLTEMDLYAGVVTIKDSSPNGVLQCPTTMLDFPSFCVKRLPGKILKEKFIFHLQIERNLEAEFNHSLPDVSMLGKVSAVHCTLDSPLFQLVRGILDNNLSEQLDIVPTISQPSETESEGLNVLLPNRIWTSMALHLDLKDVSLEVIDISSNNMLRDKVLSRIDFLSSRLSIESFTDSSKDVDLVSQEIRIMDARYQNHPTSGRPNVFPDILKPAKKVVSSSPLQLEIHYRSKRDQVCLTILLNNMRVMAIFDWFRELSDFLSQPISFNKNQAESPESKRESIQDIAFISENQPDFELKFNITDSELVVVENSAVADSNAVILKGTAILNLATDITHPEPFNCTLQGMEVFSCILGVEDQTALSIVDPLSITIDLAPKKITHPALQEGSQEEVILVFDISEISLHLSFQDIFLFLKILNSLPTQTRMLSKSPDSPRTSIDSMDSLGGSVFALPQHINQLHLLGFHRSDCVQALEACKGNINEATVWLSRNASQLLSRPELNKQVNRFSKFSFQMICLQIHSCVFCLIDDCKDTDVPLFEIRFKDIDLWQRFAPRIAGAAKFEIAADHYNRSLSGWQPVLERWPCESDWRLEADQEKKSKISFSIASSDRLSLVITNSYLQQYRAVIQSWVDEYERLTKQAEKQVARRRSPFIPFAIKNETGCDIRFYKVIPHLGTQYGHGLNSSLQASFQTLVHSNIEWIHVRPNEIIPLSFEERGKSRAQDSHRLQSHEIVVQVEGWQPVCPVSIDKVGKYFREASPDDSKLETARIVFDIILESNARKLITLRSALSLSNATNTPMEVKFGSSGNDYLYILPGMLLPVPLNLVRSKIYARPCDIGVNMCETPIIWEHVRRSSDSTSELLSCNPSTITGNQHSSYTDSSRYYFVSVVLRENFPNENKHRSAMRSMRALPAHQIIFLPTVQVINLLPFEMKFRLKNGSENTIKAGETSFLKYVDTSKECSLYFSMDNYPRSNPLILTPGSNTDFNLRLELFDKKDRPLYLLALVNLSQNSTFALSVTIVAPYWFVNRTGLPIIIKQESAEKEASGQFEEHEIARSISPLLFSFYENEFSLTCVMRLGKTYGRARFCNSFYLHKGTIVRKLRISSNDTRRPDKVYEVGIEIRNGKGRYRDSTIITLSPRYQIENSSSHNLEISQKFAIHSRENSKESLVSVPSKSNVAFHWPRSDQDRLLCIRSMSIKDCNWSGGFAVHINSSFHINLRDSQGRSHFLRLEILGQGATTFIIFSDPGNLPPPIRVDNFSEVPIEFYQTNSMHTWMKTTLKPKSSIPYSWDEPTFKPHLTVSAPGGCSATYDLNQLRAGENLSYENFFYIAFSATFLGDQNGTKNLSIDKMSDRNIMQMELVLDVPEGTRKVIINRKEPGRRSQLWRMDRYRRLLHEGSSPPRDPRKNSIVKGNSIEFALDIESQFPLPNEYSNLCIRPADNKRGLTQYWNFTKDGRLCCEHPNLFVQPRDGFSGLKISNGLVLGPCHPASRNKSGNSIPLEQALSTHKMRKGSGILSVRVCSDGPTRVLQIMDIRNIPPVGDRSPPPEMRSRTLASSQQVKMIESGKVEFNLLFKPSNVEFSLVNEFNEEIITIHLFEVVLEYLYKISEHRLNCSVRYIQGDNQLMDAEKPVIFHTMELDENNPNAGLPALNIFVHKLVLPQVEAHFFEDVQITFKDILLNLEEYLVLKVYEFLGYPESDSDLEPIDEDGSSAHRAITSALAKSPRLYFSNLQLKLDNVRLSVFTSPHLPSKLSQIKKKIRLRLVRFEDAKIDLSPFKRNYSLETFAFLIEAIVNHYRQLLKSQAAKILGSVDFLGNPLGFMNDVTDGLSELINEGSVGGLILNLAHGISDSTAKLTSALSDGLGVVAMDDRHQEIRKRIKTESSDHLKAGIKGLGVGILGGFTSIITQTYEGAVNEGGVQGFFSGFGKGLLGTITKPAVGMLDFASSAAIAVRDTSRKMVKDSWSQVNRIRPPRPRFSDYGPGSLLPHYSQEQAIAQEFFYKSPIINDRDDEEIFISFQLMRPDAAVFTTSHKVHFLTWSINNSNDRGKGQISINLQHLNRCDMHSQSANDNDQSSSQTMYYIIPFVSDESYLQSYGAYQRIADLGGKKPKIRCQSENAAKETMRYINLAKASFQQKNYTITQ